MLSSKLWILYILIQCLIVALIFKSLVVNVTSRVKLEGSIKILKILHDTEHDHPICAENCERFKGRNVGLKTLFEGAKDTLEEY